MESIWTEIRNDFEDDFKLHIDAWETSDDNEGGKVIAKINTLTKKVKYIDKRAKNDKYAQTIINETIESLIDEQRYS